MILHNKNALFIYILLNLSFLALFSCNTSTSITSWKDSTSAESKFKKILVVVLIKDLEYRTAFEYHIAAELNNIGIHAVQSLKILSPVEKYSKDDFDTLLYRNNFDGLLTVKYEGSIVKETKRNGIKYYKYFRKFFRPIRRKGYIESHKTVILESILFSTKTENNVWVATTKTEDSTDAEDLAVSVSKALIKDLIKNIITK
jgi:hypothetical protein